MKAKAQAVRSLSLPIEANLYCSLRRLFHRHYARLLRLLLGAAVGAWIGFRLKDAGYTI